MKSAITSVMLDMLTAMPKVRTVPIMPEAMPNWCSLTLPMMAVEFGAIKIPNPAPMIASSIDSSQIGVSPLSVMAARMSPAELVSIPMEVSLRAGIRSARRPAMGAAMSCSAG